MTDLPLISVALCTYNGARFIEQQLESILSQSYSHLEIIVVDDCSTDATMALVQKLAQEDSRIQLFKNEQNLGYTQNFEKALKLCTGAFIAISDQDDIWDIHKIENQFQAINGMELVYHDSELIRTDGSSMHFRISDKFNFYRGDNPAVFLYLNCVSGHSILMRASLLKQALPFPNGFHYDQWLAFVASCRGNIDFIDQCLVQYRQHDQNSTDLLALKPNKKRNKRNELLKETEWLYTCAQVEGPNSSPLPMQLYLSSLKRNESFISLAYGYLIWRNQKALLYLLKKKPISRLFYVFRKTWGLSAKKV